MRIHELEAYHQAGIGVLAVKLDVRLQQLSVGFEKQWTSGPTLEPLENFRKEDVEHSSCNRDRVEDYLTASLGGSAGVFLFNLGRRRHFQRSHGDAGLEMKHLRRMWQCVEPEVDRAFGIAFALLSKFDDSDTEATLWRLWQRAVELLRQPLQRKQLDRLARQLMQVGKMPGEEVVRFLQT